MPEVGEFGVVRTNGWAGRLIRWTTRSVVNHAFVCVGDGLIVEAQPAGARLAHASLYPGALWSGPGLTAGRGEAIAVAALALIGTPYSWVDCAAIGLTDLFGWHVPEAVRRRLNRRDRLMCSALCDEAYRRAGVQLYDDGRVAGDVSPQDLLLLIQPVPPWPRVPTPPA